MNSYELSRAFWDWAYQNPELIKPVHASLYFFIIEHCNRMGWKKKFGLPSMMAREAIGVKSHNTYINALNDLVKWGFVDMVERSINQYSSNIVALSNFNKADVKALDKALIKHMSKQSESTVQSIDNIDKQRTKEQRTKEQGTSVKPKKVFTREVHECFVKCEDLFPDHLHPKLSTKAHFDWLDCIDKLNRIDGIPFEKIVQIVKAAREDDFWSKNFLSLTKLRKKDKNGVPYVVVFNERFNGQQKTQPSKFDELKRGMQRIYEKRTGGLG